MNTNDSIRALVSFNSSIVTLLASGVTMTELKELIGAHKDGAKPSDEMVEGIAKKIAMRGVEEQVKAALTAPAPSPPRATGTRARFEGAGGNKTVEENAVYHMEHRGAASAEAHAKRSALLATTADKKAYWQATHEKIRELRAKAG